MKQPRLGIWHCSALLFFSLLLACDDDLEFAACVVAYMNDLGSVVNSGDVFPTDHFELSPPGTATPELLITSSEDPAARMSSTGTTLAWGCPGDCWSGTYSDDTLTVRLRRVDQQSFHAAPILFESPPTRSFEAVVTSEGGGTLAFDGSEAALFEDFPPQEAWYGAWIQFEVPRDRYLYVEDMKVCWTAEDAP